MMLFCWQNQLWPHRITASIGRTCSAQGISEGWSFVCNRLNPPLAPPLSLFLMTSLSVVLSHFPLTPVREVPGQPSSLTSLVLECVAPSSMSPSTLSHVLFLDLQGLVYSCPFVLSPETVPLGRSAIPMLPSSRPLKLVRSFPTAPQSEIIFSPLSSVAQLPEASIAPNLVGLPPPSSFLAQTLERPNPVLPSTSMVLPDALSPTSDFSSLPNPYLSFADFGSAYGCSCAIRDSKFYVDLVHFGSLEEDMIDGRPPVAAVNAPFPGLFRLRQGTVCVFVDPYYNALCDCKPNSTMPKNNALYLNVPNPAAPRAVFTSKAMNKLRRLF